MYKWWSIKSRLEHSQLYLWVYVCVVGGAGWSLDLLSRCECLWASLPAAGLDTPKTHPHTQFSLVNLPKIRKYVIQKNWQGKIVSKLPDARFNLYFQITLYWQGVRQIDYFETYPLWFQKKENIVFIAKLLWTVNFSKLSVQAVLLLVNCVNWEILLSVDNVSWIMSIYSDANIAFLTGTVTLLLTG